MQGVCRIWSFSLIVVIFLTLYNILRTIRLMQLEDCSQNAPKIIQKNCDNEKKPAWMPLNVDNPYYKLDVTLGRLDNSLQYKLFDNILVGSTFTTSSFRSCLATQSSLDKLASIIQVAEHWNGPISLAAFAPNNEEFNKLLLYILFLRQCYQKIKDQVNFHFAFPKINVTYKIKMDYEKLDQMSCDDPLGALYKLVKKRKNDILRKWRNSVAYPQNHLRNLARKNCQHKYVFLTDVDIIPSRGMAEALDSFLKTSLCKKLCAFVIPTYELDERVRFPDNKTDLIRMAKKGLARPFHHKVFIYNQFATNFSRWEHEIGVSYKVHISHPVTNFEFLYEPFYVAPDSVPVHDERFIGYGYTRNSQVYEMFVSGYEFFVLSPIFTCHWGLQVKRTRPPWREHQNTLNRKQFEGFKREIFAKYKKDPLNMLQKKKTT